MKKKVFIVEDETAYYDFFARGLKRIDLECILIPSIKGVEEITTKLRGNGGINSEVLLIIFDGEIEGRCGGKEETLGLIKDIRRDFKGLMVAMSGKPGLRKKQLAAGCDLSLECKDKLYEVVRALVAAGYEKSSLSGSIDNSAFIKEIQSKFPDRGLENSF